MQGFYRIAAAAPRLHLGDPAANAKELVRLAKDAAKNGVAAIVFPELCLTGYTCGDDANTKNRRRRPEFSLARKKSLR